MGRQNCGLALCRSVTMVSAPAEGSARHAGGRQSECRFSQRLLALELIKVPLQAFAWLLGAAIAFLSLS